MNFSKLSQLHLRWFKLSSLMKEEASGYVCKVSNELRRYHKECHREIIGVDICKLCTNVSSEMESKIFLPKRRICSAKFQATREVWKSSGGC